MLKGGIIGFGRMGLTHFSILNNHPEVQFVAVCDASKLMRKNVSQFLKLKAYDDYVKMLEQEALDFVIVATPTSMHAEVVELAIEKRIHTFVEKPFTLNPNEGKRLVEKVEKTDLVNQVGYVIRFNDVIREVKRLVDSGAIGDLYFFKMEMLAPTILQKVKSGWRSKRSQGGGCLYDFASHGVDLINYIVGEPKGVTGTILQNIYSEGVEDLVKTNFIYDDHLNGTLFVNWCDASCRKPMYRLELYGGNGKIIADLHAFKVFFNNEPDNDPYKKGWNIRYITEFFKPVRFYVRGLEFTRQLDYFIQGITTKRKENVCSFKEGLGADIVMEKITLDASEKGVC